MTGPIVIKPDNIDQVVINRLCDILARDLFFHHRAPEYGSTPQSDALQAALTGYLQHYDPKRLKKRPV